MGPKDHITPAMKRFVQRTGHLAGRLFMFFRRRYTRMIAGTNLLNNRLRLRSHSIRRTFVRAGRAVFSQLIRWVDLGTAVSEFYPQRLFSNIHFHYGFVPFGMPIRRGIPGTPTPSNARI
jgi:hypothetical protein